MNLWNQLFSPMLLSEIDKPFNDNNYIYEIKYDGIRVLIYVNSSSLKIITRNKRDITYLFPELEIIKDKINANVIFDGEIISTVDGLPNFSAIQERIHLKDKNKIEYFSLNKPVTFVCFDIIYENKNLTNLSLLKRKEVLNKYEDDSCFVKSFYVEKEGIKLFREIKKMNLEGIVAKNKNSKYYINIRTDKWMKIKNFKSNVFLIGGYKVNKSLYVITILLGEYINAKLYYVGSCILNKKDDLYQKIIKSQKVKNNFVNLNDNEAIYIKPSLKIEISYLERTKDNKLRGAFIKK